MTRNFALLLCALISASLPYPVYSQQVDINIGISGSWWTPAWSGQGMLIEVIPSSEQIFVAWFTFKDEDDDSIVSSEVADEQRWYVAQGVYDGVATDIPLFITKGGRFNAPDPVDLVQIGSLSIGFSSCNEGQIEVLFDGDTEKSTVPIQRLTQDFNCIRLFPTELN